MNRYSVGFNFGTYIPDPTHYSFVAEVDHEVDLEQAEVQVAHVARNEIIAEGLKQYNQAYPRTYSATVTKMK